MIKRGNYAIKKYLLIIMLRINSDKNRMIALAIYHDCRQLYATDLIRLLISLK